MLMQLYRFGGTVNHGRPTATRTVFAALVFKRLDLGLCVLADSAANKWHNAAHLHWPRLISGLGDKNAGDCCD